jgi:hypothetical protein
MTMTNVERLVHAKVLDASGLTQPGRDKINGLYISDDEIAILKRFKEELGLDPLKLIDPTQTGAISGMGSL